MSSMKITGKLSRFLPAITSPSAAWRWRIFATKATTPLQSRKGSEKETLERTTEAADAVRDGAKEVRVTTEKLTDIASNTSDSVSKMGKDVKEKVTKTKKAVTGKTKNKVSGVVETTKTATEFVKGKVTK